MQVSIDEKANELIIRLPLQKPTPSASGKTLVIASSRGNVKTETELEGRQITVGVNAYLMR